MPLMIQPNVSKEDIYKHYKIETLKRKLTHFQKYNTYIYLHIKFFLVYYYLKFHSKEFLFFLYLQLQCETSSTNAIRLALTA